ncbi:MAG: HAMP domain-containing sensor histidine kinase [Planctomycetota bacterium]|nr:HAMP domain-containing sensor histidine kinase [Planctomycetota bacterium]MDA1214380.1 HAMP domain-containing sensor histidine kinase [Planctomycetota bacterium]
MRWPIRNQILIPFVVIQCTSLAIIVSSSAWIAVRQVEEDLNIRLNNVLDTLEASSFPLTPTVLDQLHPLSGADYVVLDSQNHVLSATLTGISTGLIEEIIANNQQANAMYVLRHDVVTVNGERFFVGKANLKGRANAGGVIVLYPEKSWEMARWEALSPPLTIGAGLLFLTFVASVAIARKLGNRILRVQHQVSRIAGGDFEPIDISSIDDELKDLSLSVNRMCIALEESWDRLRETERSQLVSQIVGGIAHQLRNAITGARISLQVHRGRCPKQDDEAIDVSLKQLTLMEEQIKGLLRLTRGESRTAFAASVGEILEEILAMVAPICLHKKIELQFGGETIAAKVPDADALRAALLNLIMNAIEACGPHGRVDVVSREVSDQVVIEVSDNGPGIPTELETEIFQPFFSTKSEGIGLGLALARQAAIDCKGTLSLHQSDGWTTFRLTLKPMVTNDGTLSRAEIQGIADSVRAT